MNNRMVALSGWFIGAIWCSSVYAEKTIGPLSAQITATIYERPCHVTAGGKDTLDVSFGIVDVRDVVNRVQTKTVKVMNFELSCAGTAGRNKVLKAYVDPRQGTMSEVGNYVMRTDKTGLGIALYKGDGVKTTLPLVSWQPFWGTLNTPPTLKSPFQMTAELRTNQTRLSPGVFSALVNLLVSYQ